MRSRFALSMLALALAWPAWAQSTTNVPYFAPPEIYPIDQNIALLHAADLNGDGLNDLIIANNLRSKINLLYNRTGKTNSPATPWTPSGVNSLPPGARFRIDSLPVDEGIAAMSVADLNGDGRPDIVFYGDGKNLEIIYNEGTNGWSDPKRWNIPDGSMDPNALAVGDLNGDGRPDILLLGDNGSMYFWPQLPDRTFGEPQKIPYSGSPKAVQITDINGDGRKDLLLVDWDSQTPFRFRLQNSAGQLGPEIYFKTQPLHAYTASHLNGDSNLFVVTISESSDRAAISQFTQKPAEPLAGLSGPGNEALRRGQFQVLPLKKTDAAKRGEAWADVNGDGRPDLLIADPESGQISIYFQRPDGSLAPPETFPSLAGVSQIVVSDWNGDGRPEIFLLSRDESAVGVTQFDRKGRLPFPTLVPIEGKPLVMAVGRLKPRAKPTLCVIVDNNGKRSLVMDNADGKIRSQKLSDSFQGDPVDMAMDDVNQDGRPDLVILIPYEKIKVLLQKPDGFFDEQDVEPPGGAIAQPWLAAADIEGNGKPELLLPQQNFIRAVVLERQKMPGLTNRMQWVFRVTDQINGASDDSQIAGATAIRIARGRIPALFLLDAQYHQLTLCGRDTNGVWRVAQNIVLPVSDFTGLQPVALGPGLNQSVAFSGRNAVAWMPLGGKVWQFTTYDEYDTPIQNGYLNDVATANFTGRRKDLVFMETGQHYLDIVGVNARHKFVPLTRWQVFESHTFRGAMSAVPEPREVLAANVTGHRGKDLLVVVHDRILVYPRE